MHYSVISFKILWLTLNFKTKSFHRWKILIIGKLYIKP